MVFISVLIFHAVIVPNSLTKVKPFYIPNGYLARTVGYVDMATAGTGMTGRAMTGERLKRE